MIIIITIIIIIIISEFQKTINSLETIPDNKDLVKNKSKFMINEKKNYSNNKENWINTPFVLNIKHDSIV